MKKLPVTYLLCCFAVFTACEKETDQPAFEDQPVVEAYLAPGEPITMEISHLVPFDSDYVFSTDISQLTVQVSDGNQTYSLTYAGNGLFVSDPSVTVDEGTTYSVVFDYNGKQVSATTAVPLKPQNFNSSVSVIEIEQIDPNAGMGGGLPEFPDPVKLTWTNTDGSYYLVVVENIESDPEAINTSSDEAPDRIFRNEPVQNDTYEIQSMQFQYYGTHRLILYHINAEYAALYDDNGSSSQNLTDPSSNVVNGLGIFTAIHSDTLMLEVNKP